MHCWLIGTTALWQYLSIQDIIKPSITINNKMSFSTYFSNISLKTLNITSEKQDHSALLGRESLS